MYPYIYIYTYTDKCILFSTNFLVDIASIVDTPIECSKEYERGSRKTEAARGEWITCSRVIPSWQKVVLVPWSRRILQGFCPKFGVWTKHGFPGKSNSLAILIPVHIQNILRSTTSGDGSKILLYLGITSHEPFILWYPECHLNSTRIKKRGLERRQISWLSNKSFKASGYQLRGRGQVFSFGPQTRVVRLYNLDMQ